MKKVLIAVVMLFTLSGCSLFQTEFERAIINFETVESVRLDITINNIPYIDTMNIVELIDGHLSKTWLFMKGYISPQTILYENEGTFYQIIDHDGESIGVPVVFEEDLYKETIDSCLDDLKEFDPKDFKKGDDDFYTSETEFENITLLKIKVEDDYITQVRFRMVVEGITVRVVIDLSGFNATEFDVPEFRCLDEFEAAVYNMEQRGFTYNRGATQITFKNPSLVITYSLERKTFSIWRQYDSQSCSLNPKTESGLTEEEFKEKRIYSFINYKTYLDLMEVSEHTPVN